MKTLRNILIIMLIIAILAFGYLLYHTYQNPNYIIKTDTVLITETITELVPDTVITEKIIYKDKVLTLNDTVHLTDTIWVYNDYSKKYVYSDTIFKPDTLLFTLTDTLQYNRIKTRSYTLKTFNKTITELPKGLYLGGGLNSIGSINIGASYLKNKNMFTLEGGYNANLKGGFIGFDYKHKIGFAR